MENTEEINVSADELAQAFQPEKKSKKNLISIIVFIVGMITLVVGVVFLIIKLVGGPALEDGEYLVSAKEWALKADSDCKSEEVETKCMPSVYWQFTEIGKGTLTTNNHLNDYDFIWSLEDGKLKIETDWLYTLENEYDYELNQRDGILILRTGNEELKFVAEFETE